MTRSSPDRIKRRLQKRGQSPSLVQTKADSRTPPIEIRRRLRREVGFGCPVPGCRNPFLEYHHFDPPWRIEHHHRPEGMIALCESHHSQAGGGAFTDDQIREMKRAERSVERPVSARFNWMRNSLLVVAGGMFFYEVKTMVQYRSMPVIWFNRDEFGHQLLNVRMLSRTSEKRLWIQDHDWILHGEPEDVECPPSGRFLNVKYSNGDAVRVEFSNISSVDSDLAGRFQLDDFTRERVHQIPTPITLCELHYAVGGTDINFGPRDTRLPGVTITGAFNAYNAIGMRIG